MLFHMLRRKLGDARFIEGLRRFYTVNKFKTAGFKDLQQVFESVSGSDLADFFTQWTGRTGAPALAVDDVQVTATGPVYRLTGVLRQTQAEPPFRLDVPLHVYLEPPAKPVSLSHPMDCEGNPVHHRTAGQAPAAGCGPLVRSVPPARCG